jgi:L-aminopeptidase/D-esterase-like protein
MITSVPGVRVGHWSDTEARTGCTVVLLPSGTAASGEVRGGAPGTREWALLSPGGLVSHVDAVVLTGGSAFGLAACDGVVAWCEERGLGFATGAGAVPIVVGLVLYDLGVGDAGVRPDREAGYAACAAARDGEVATGAVGAATGATVAKAWGPDRVRPGWLGTAAVADGDLVVGALVAVNAVGDVRDVPDSGLVEWPRVRPPLGESTTIGVLVTNARLDQLGCRHVAGGGHDGYARALDPIHTSFDGDAVVACATGALAEADADADHVRVLAAAAMEAAIRSSPSRT